MSIALRNLLRHKRRSLLTLLGVAIGISAFVALVTFSNGLKTQFNDIIRTYKIDIAVESKGAATPLSSRISMADYNSLRNFEDIEEISSVIIGTIKTQGKSYFIIIGINSFEMLANRINMMKGRIFHAGEREILLGYVAAKDLDYDVDSKILLLKQELFTISGIYATGSTIFDNAAVLHIDDVRRILKREDYINIALIRVKQGIDPESLIEKIEKEIPDLLAVRSGEFLESIKMNEAVEAFALIASLISLIIAGIFVVNTMLMSISERTKEIGILMAVGWSRLMVIKTIMAESIILSLLGGILGNIFGLILLWIFNSSRITGLDWMNWVPTSLSMVIVLKSISLSVILGALCSLYPSFIVSRLLPADALRYE